MTQGGKFAATPYLFDHFDNSQLDAPIYRNPFGFNGSILEPAGSTLNFDAPNSLECQWYTTTRNAPIAAAGLPTAKFLRIGTRLSAFARTTNLCLAGIYVGRRDLTANQGLYYLVFYPNENRLICDRNADTRLYNGPGGDPNSTPHRYRIYINRDDSSHIVHGSASPVTIPKNSVSFWYSVDDGATEYVHLGTRTLEFTPDLAGMFLRKWATGGGDNAQASFDYFKIEEFVQPITDRYSQKGDFAEDRGQIVSSGGPADHRRHDGLGAGQLVPGPQTQQNDSTGPFPSGGFGVDQLDLVDTGGPELHRAPDGLKGGLELGGGSQAGVGGDQVGLHGALEEIHADQVMKAQGGDSLHAFPAATTGVKVFDRHGGALEELLFFDLQLDAGFVIGSYQWGAVTPTGTPPEVSGAVGGDGAGLPGSVVRVTFDTAMRDHPYLGGVLDPRNYDLRHDLTARRLPIIQVRRVSATQVDLYTEEFPAPHAEDYTVTVTNVQSANGDLIAGDNSASFAAAGTGFPLGDTLRTWYGLDAGFQSDLATGVQPDTDAPVLQNQSPAPTDTGVAIDSNIILEVVDTGAGLDASSVWIKVNGVLAWSGDAQQPGFVVSKDPVVNGWKYTINPDALLPEGLPTTIQVYARDAAPFPNVLLTSYFFTCGFVDILGPYLTNQNPAPGGTGAIGQNIIFEVRDDKTDPDDTQTTIWIAGTPARINGVDQPGFSVVRTVLSLPFPQKGVKYDVNPAVDFLPSITVTVRVKTQDSGGPPNVIDVSYNYETTPDLLAPQLVRLNPAIEEEDVQPTRGVRLSLIDDFQVVDSSIQIWIRDVLAYYQGSFRPDFANSVKQANTENGFDFVIVPDADLQWDRNERVKVRVVAQDTVPNTLDVTYYFTGLLAPEQPFSVYRMIMQAVRLARPARPRPDPRQVAALAEEPGRLHPRPDLRPDRRRAAARDQGRRRAVE
jgi:hypothetical protein